MKLVCLSVCMRLCGNTFNVYLCFPLSVRRESLCMHTVYRESLCMHTVYIPDILVNTTFQINSFILSTQTGKSKGYAYIEFQHKEVAKLVAETMNNYLMFTRILKCKYQQILCLLGCNIFPYDEIVLFVSYQGRGVNIEEGVSKFQKNQILS